MKKIAFTLILIIAVVFTGSAQNKKMKEKSNEQVEKLNSELISIDKSYALTEEQREQLYTLHMEKAEEMQKLRKEGAEKDDLKAVNKKYNQKIMKEILTKEQMKARREAKQKEKGE